MVSTTTLKNAAFAIEHDLFTDPDGCNYLVKDGAIVRRWDPEHSSADSFELMCKRRIDLNYFPGFGEVHASDEGGMSVCIQDYTSDLAADTRLAILMCVAQIGESLKCQS